MVSEKIHSFITINKYLYSGIMRSIIFIGLLLFQLSASGIEINKKNIRIVRDGFGVPHIYAPTDEEVAYGLAWATAEDDFQSMQENFLTVRGRLASVKGKDGAVMDFLAAFIGARQVAEEQYATAFSPKYRRILESYCQAVNDYAAKHPKEVLVKKMLPVTPQDMVAGYVIGMALMTNVHFNIIKVSSGTINSQELSTPKGSNGFAINGQKTADGSTYLAVNSHQPLQGPYSWYEAHLHSKEGWNILGGTFPGGTTIFHGVNEHLGWAHTVSMSDLSDIYKLTMHDKHKLKYRFDGQWLDLEKKHIWMKVKLFWFIKIPVRKTFYKSVHGPVLQGKDGHFYAMRFPANMDIRAAEQWYRMNKATDFDSFYEALKMQGITGLNIIYADKKGNIMHLDNACFPKRDTSYNWWGILPGDTSATLWKANDYYPIEALSQVKNPDCGYVFNTNNSPFEATGTSCNPHPDAMAVSRFYFPYENNRSLLIKELLERYDKVDYKAFKAIKFNQDIRTPAYTYSISNLEALFNLNPKDYPELADIITLMKSWDRRADVNSKAATIGAILIQKYISRKISMGNIPNKETEMPLPEMIDILKETKEHLLKYFGRIDVPLGTVQKLVRGDRELPIGGIPDVLAAMNVAPYKKGTFKAEGGESYIMLIRFTPEGPEIETISPYGASNRPESPHYDDQMEMFLAQQLKPMSLDTEAVMKQAKRTYHPE
jgi:acyl-homoserine-lactone acylase